MRSRIKKQKQRKLRKGTHVYFNVVCIDSKTSKKKKKLRPYATVKMDINNFINY